MKNTKVLFLVALSALALTACGSDKSSSSASDTGKDNPTTAVNPTTENSTTNPNPTTGDSKTSDQTSSSSSTSKDETSKSSETSESSNSSSEELDETIYYLVGSFNDWTAKDEYKLTENAANEGEYYILDVYIPANSELKVQDPSLGDFGYYAYANDDRNFTIGDEGYYDFYFNPNGNIDWGDSYIFCMQHQDGHGTSEETSNPTSGDEGSSSESSSLPEFNGYYLVGTFNNWTAKDEYKLSENRVNIIFLMSTLKLVHN